MIKILFFLPSLAGGGEERVVVNLANGLDVDKFEIYILVIDSPEEGKYKDVYSNLLKTYIKLINLKITIHKYNYFKITNRIAKKIFEVKPNIIVSTMFRPNLLCAVALKMSKHSCKYIIRETTNPEKRKMNCIEKIIYKKIYGGGIADMVIAPSDGVRSSMIKQGMNADNIMTIHNPVDIDFINQKKIEHQDEIVKDNRTKIIAVGRLIQAKNYPMFINALSILYKKHDFDAYILGEGPLRNEMESMIQDLEMEGHIHLLGFKDNPFAYMYNSDIFVLTSTYEGFGNVLVEAMACDTVVISTDCPYGPNEIITNEENGMLCPVNDIGTMVEMLEKVMLDRQLKENMVEQGREKIKCFGLNNIIKQYEELFERIIC